MKSLAPLISIVLLVIALEARADDTIYAPDDDGFIHNWVILDAIPVDPNVVQHTPNTCRQYFDKPLFAGQREVRPQDGDRATVGNKELTWHAVQSLGYYVDLAAMAIEAGQQSERAVYIGKTYVTAPAELRNVVLAIGSDDDSAWWVNGSEVTRAYASRAVGKDQDISRPLTLKKGINVIRFVVINGIGKSAAAARFLDEKHKPIVSLMISVKPPTDAG